MRSGLLICVLLLGACAANREYFEPTERVHGQTLHGYRESMYELVGAQGRFGEAKLWSRGAYRHDDRTVVQIGMELHNTSAAPFELRAKDVWLEPVRVSDGVVQSVAPAEQNDFVFAPEAIGSANFHFVMPPGISPSEVIAFRLRWSVYSGAHVYSQNTPFRRDSRSDGYYGAYAYGPGYGWCSAFDPFCYSPAPYGYVAVPYRYDGAGPRVVVHPRR
jgi:hypothetical protein